MEDKEKKVFEAALAGDWVSLNTLVREDPLLLDRISLSPYETPLHVAALRGHDDFARCLLSHCPRLASESDTLGRSPLHVAAAAGHIGVVREIIRCAPPEEGGANSICLVKSKAGMIPLHAAVMKGRVEIVRELVSACPESTRVRLARGETVLHLCVRYDWLEVMKVIVEMDGGDGNSSLLEQTDDDGNTVFHLAALHKQLEIIKYLHARPNNDKIDPNAQNKMKFTALDLLSIYCPRDAHFQEISTFLLHSGAKRSIDLPSSSSSTNTTLLPPENNINWKTRLFTYTSCYTSRLDQLRGSLMIATSFITLATYEVGVIPPPYGDNKSGLWRNNTIAFAASLTVVVLLITGFPFKHNVLCVWLLLTTFFTCLAYMALAYLSSVGINEDRWTSYIGITFYSIIAYLLVVMCVVALVNLIRLLVWVRRRMRKLKFSVSSWRNSLCIPDETTTAATIIREKDVA